MCARNRQGAFGVLNAHYIVTASATFGPQGQAIYTALRDVQNLQLMTCGSVLAQEPARVAPKLAPGPARNVPSLDRWAGRA